MIILLDDAFSNKKIAINAFQVTKIESYLSDSAIIYLADGCRATVRGTVEEITAKLIVFTKDA